MIAAIWKAVKLMRLTAALRPIGNGQQMPVKAKFCDIFLLFEFFVFFFMFFHWLDRALKHI